MPRINSRFLSLLLAMLFTGCASVVDVSTHDRVRGSVGQTMALRRPMLLIQHSGYIFGGADDVMSRRPVRYGLAEPGTYRAPRIFAELPSGHRVTIDAIDEETCIEAYQTVVYGRTTFPPSGRQVSFAYVCAPLVYLHSQSLPWEE